MSERALVREDIRIPRNAVNELATHFERSKLPLTARHLELMVQEIVTADLSTDPLAQYLGDTPLAKVEDGRITFDRRFEQLAPEQQRYILAHEYSHILDWFLAGPKSQEHYLPIVERINQLPDGHISPYIQSIRQRFKEGDEAEQFIESEKRAEVIAQYLTSDRTFAGFITSQLLQFEADPNAQAKLNELRGNVEEITNLAAYLDIANNELDREEFLNHHEHLRDRYELWQSLDELFNQVNFDDLENPEVAALLDGSTWEDEELAMYLHPEEISSDDSPRTAFPPPQPPAEPTLPFANLLTFWRLYP